MRDVIQYEDKAPIQTLTEKFWSDLLEVSEVLRRCLLPTVLALVMVALLNLPQTQEFFSGLLNVCVFNPRECSVPFGVHASARQFICFQLVAALFCTLIWYSARALTSYRNTGDATLPKQSTQSVWVPRVIGAAPLYLLSYAVLQPLEYQVSAALLVWTLGASTVLVMLPAILHFRVVPVVGKSGMYWGIAAGVFAIVGGTIHPSRESRFADVLMCVPLVPVGLCYFKFAKAWFKSKAMAFICLLPIAIVVAASLQGIGFGTSAATGWGSWTWTASSVCLTPAIFLFVVTYRRRLGLHLWGKRIYGKLKDTLPISELAHRIAPDFPPRCVILLVFSMILAMAVVAVVIRDSEMAAEFLFAPSAIILWLIVAVLLVYGFLLLITIRIRFLIVVLFIGANLFGGVPRIKLAQSQASLDAELCNDRAGVCKPADVINRQFSAWQALHGGEFDTKPIVLVAAAGGGARAAAHTATILAAVDAATCGDFGDRIFAISAVSGGALGAATYTASRDDLGFLHEDKAKCWNTKLPAERPNRLMNPLTRFTTADHLTPSLIRALFRDLPLSLLPTALRPAYGEAEDYYGRAGALYHSWTQGYEYVVATERRLAGVQSSPSTRYSFGRARTEPPGAAEGKKPFLLLNAMAVQDGRRVVMSSPLLCPVDGYCSQGLGNAAANAVDSARFPIMSPPVNREMYGWSKKEEGAFITVRSVVDGGYFDNSGVQTLIDVFDGLVKIKNMDRSRIYVVIIGNDPREGEPWTQVDDYASTGLWAQLLAPIQAVVNSRAGRSEGVLVDLKSRVKPTNIIYWPLRKDFLSQVDEKSNLAMQRPAEVLAREKLRGYTTTEERFVYGPPLGWALSQEAGQFIALYSMSRARGFEHPDNYIFEHERKFAELLRDSHGK